MNQSKSKGFTIIEVVLVLAIAGLIFLVVFLALPALQSGQRDTQRKNDAGRMASQITAYQTNNQGALPTSWTGTSNFMTNYMVNNNQQFNDPSTGATYTITAPASPQATSGITAGNIWIYPGYRCDSAQTTGVTAAAGSRNYAILMFQEQGVYFCQSN